MAPPSDVPKNFKHFFFFDRVLVDPFVITSFSQNVEFVVMVVDLTQVEANLANNKEKTKCIRGTVISKLKLPLAKSILGVDGKVTHVKCKMCIVIEGKINSLCLSWICCGNMLVKRRPQLC